MSDLVTVYCTFPTAEEARRIGRQVVEERLAACINVLAPCHSIYRWEEKIEEAEEFPAIIKCTADVAQRLMKRLAELHSYEVPAISAWPVSEAYPACRQWVMKSIG